MTNDLTFDFTGTRVLVTGGTSGIGHGIATAFRDAGAGVTITGTKATSVAYETDLGGMAYRKFDATSAESALELASSIDALDVLVNNAGATFPGGLDEYDPAGFEAAIAVNLLAPYRLMHALHDHLATSPAAGGGSVIGIVSMAAFRAVPIVPGYGSAKAGLMQATRNLAARWAADGIRVNAVAPGNIETPMTAPMNAIPSLVEEQLAHIPMRRFGVVVDVVPAVLYLASRQASYVTGAVVAVDGGYLTL